MLAGQHLPTPFGYKNKASVCIFNHCTWTSKNDFSFNNWIEGLGLTSMDPVLFFSKRLQSFCHNLEGYPAFNTGCWPISQAGRLQQLTGPQTPQWPKGQKRLDQLKYKQENQHFLCTLED